MQGCCSPAWSSEAVRLDSIPRLDCCKLHWVFFFLDPLALQQLEYDSHKFFCYLTHHHSVYHDYVTPFCINNNNTLPWTRTGVSLLLLLLYAGADFCYGSTRIHSLPDSAAKHLDPKIWVKLSNHFILQLLVREMLVRLVTWAHGGGPRVRVAVCVSSSQWILSIVPKMKIKMGIADWLAYIDTTLRMQTLSLPIQDAHEVRGPSKVLESLHANGRRVSLLDNHMVWSSYLNVKATLILRDLTKMEDIFFWGGIFCLCKVPQNFKWNSAGEVLFKYKDQIYKALLV